jgi:hypothetical protein
MLTTGFKTKDKLIENRELFRFDTLAIALMKARYQAVFNNIIPTNIK